MTKAVAIPDLIDDETLLANIDSFGDALAALESAGVNIVDSNDLGSGFRVMDKATLVKVPFIMLGYRFAMGDHGEFSIAFIVTEEDQARKGIIIDGGTGILAQLKLYNEKNIQSIRFRDGLTRSDFEYDDEGVIKKNPNGDGYQRAVVGKVSSATTYYLST